MCIKVNQYKCFVKREDRKYFVKNAEDTFFQENLKEEWSESITASGGWNNPVMNYG